MAKVTLTRAPGVPGAPPNECRYKVVSCSSGAEVAKGIIDGKVVLELEEGDYQVKLVLHSPLATINEQYVLSVGPAQRKIAKAAAKAKPARKKKVK